MSVIVRLLFMLIAVVLGNEVHNYMYTYFAVPLPEEMVEAPYIEPIEPVWPTADVTELPSPWIPNDSR